MSRLKTIRPEQATGETEKLYSAIKSALGGVPNIFQGLGANPRALGIFLGIGEGLKGGLLSGADQEVIALAVAQKNSCDYCLSAHTVLGKMNGLADGEMIQIRKGTCENTKRNALVRLVHEIVSEKGHVSDSTLAHFREQGFTDAHVPEILLSVIQNIFTNYFNHINQTEIDFPRASAL